MNSKENLLIFLFNFMFLIKSNTCTILTKPTCLQVKNQEGFKGWKRIWLVKNYIFRIVIKPNVAIICFSCEIKLRKSLAWLFQNSDANSQNRWRIILLITLSPPFFFFFRFFVRSCERFTVYIPGDIASFVLSCL